MQKSIYLLEEALKEVRLVDLSKISGAKPEAIINARKRGSLTASMAWNIAEAGGEDPIFWSTLASAETERESVCKDRMMKSIRSRWSEKLKEPPALSWRKL